MGFRRVHGAVGAGLAGVVAFSCGVTGGDGGQEREFPTRSAEQALETAAEEVSVDVIAKGLIDAHRTHRDLVCPGQTHAFSCGNYQCDPLLGENKDSCPADCRVYKIGSYNNLPICEEVQSVVHAKSVADVSNAVRMAVATGRRVTPIGAKHSASRILCGDGVVIDMTGLADESQIELRGQEVLVPAGLKMKALGDYLHDRGYSVGFTHLGFNGVTVAGAIATAAHGSSPIHSNSLSYIVTSFDVVGPDGTERHYSRAETSETVWRALQTNLGVLGIVTRVGLALQPAFQLETQIDFLPDDSLVEGKGALGLVAGCDWGQMNWFPGQGKVVRWCAKKTQAAPQPGARNILLDPGVPVGLIGIAKELFHIGTCNVGVTCLLEQWRFKSLESSPPLAATDERGKTYHPNHLIGRSHDMMSASLIDLGKNVYFQMDWEVAVPQKYIQPTLEIARKVFRERSVCLPGAGAFLRFGLIEKGGWLTYHGAGGEFKEGETALFFETPVTVPAGYSAEALKEYLGLYRELASVLIERFGARAHWGKNMDSLFQREVELGTFRQQMNAFNQAVAVMDPYGVFSNDYAKLVGVRWPRAGEDFTRRYTRSECTCPVTAEPVCDRRQRVDYANPCRAACAKRDPADLLAGTCDRYRFVTIPLTGLTMAYKDGGKLPASTWK